MMEEPETQGHEEQVIKLLADLHDSLGEMVSPPSNSDVTEEDSYILSYLKFGQATVDAFINLLDSIPHIWSDNVRLFLLEREWVGTRSVQELLDWIVPWYKPKNLPSEQCLYLGPPTGVCYSCCNDLKLHNLPINVKYAASSGLILRKKKITLRCSRSNCTINYRYDMFGTKDEGYRFYNIPRDAVLAVNTVIVDKKVFALQWSFSQHAWVSSEGFAESWHEAYQHTREEAIDRRTWMKSFWWGELEEELHRLEANHQIDDVGYRFHAKQDSMDECMAYIDMLRSKAPYMHPEEDCSSACKLRGCGKLWATDGLWKIRFAHCMFHVKNVVGDVQLLNYPSVCANEPLPGKAFCSFHCEFVQNTTPNVPVTLREFLQFKGTDASDESDLEEDISDEEDTSSSSSRRGHSEPNAPLHQHSADYNSEDSLIDSDSSNEDYDTTSNGKHYDQGTSPLAEQTGQEFLQQNVACVTEILCETSEAEVLQPRCNKDLGKRSTLRRMSRGIQVVVRAGGHIDMWTPLYVSESNGQVFLFLITWLYEILKNMPPTDWHKVILCYDNMCQLVRMRVSRQLLSLPKPYDEMWMNITKVIDTLHVRNHVMDMCKTDLHPDKIGQIHPELKDSKNTQAAEQTFVYLGRHWRVINSMTKTHNLFYLHRLCIRRNEYITKCNKMGKRPLLPSRKRNYTSSGAKK